MTKYGFGKTVEIPFDDAIVHVTQALQDEGFGILADIDVAGTMKKKLNQDMPPYRILGACNPPLAQRALESEPSIGLLLPCNVVVRQDEAGTVHVEFMDPNAVLELVNKPEITALASEVRQRLERVSVALGGSEEARSTQTDESMAKVKVDTQPMLASSKCARPCARWVARCMANVCAAAIKGGYHHGHQTAYHPDLPLQQH
ncbi:MAG: hypothetical protein B7Y21_14895 [Hydrogenophilales bacterium 16-61-112]|nr:MAG: hypothetical protein B7Y21_14895 [Hydrogenophilales bacterium 16-61-112]